MPKRELCVPRPLCCCPSRAVPENPAPVAAVKAGLTTFSLRNVSDDA